MISLPSLLFLISLLLSIVAFAFDVFIPQGYTEWPFYLFPLIAVSFGRNPRSVFIITLLNSILLIIGYAYPGSEDINSSIVIFHRCIGLVMLWGFATSITLFAKMQNELKDSEDRFRQLADSMPQLVWTARPDGTVDYYNQRIKEFNEAHPKHVGDIKWRPVLYGDDEEVTLNMWTYAVKTGSLYQIEHRMQHADGTFHWYLSRGVPVYDINKRITKWFGTTTNIDDIKNAEQSVRENQNRLLVLNENLESIVVERTKQVRALSKALTLAEYRERRRFSIILHEDLQQVLFSAKMQLDLLQLRYQSTATAEDNEIAESLRLLEKALRITRSLSLELNPPVLETEGLYTALSWLSTHMRSSYNLISKLHVEGKVNAIQGDMQLLLVQMVRELLMNVIKHAGVLHAYVEVVCKKRMIRITVSDHGKGFDVKKSSIRNHEDSRLGLFSIEERLRMFSGTLHIESSPGHGTRCLIEVPYEIC